MEYMYKLKDKLCKELEEIARKPELSAGDLETIHKLTDTIKNIDKIVVLEDGGGYSSTGGWEIDGRGVYERGSSYRRHRDSMRRYSRDEGYSRDDGYGRNGGYSRSEGKDRMRRQLQEMMESAGSDREREAFRRAMSEIDRG